jgi:hypothetical protein
MTVSHWDAGEHRAWNHYKQTGVVIPGYQGVVADGLARLERERVEEDPPTAEEEQRLRV